MAKDPFKWEEAYTDDICIQSALHEDEHGSMESAIRRIISEEKRLRRNEGRPTRIRLGMMRHVFIGIDLSTSILSKDVEPSRLRVVRECFLNFINKFFELNPLSAMGLLLGRDKKAECSCGFSSSIQKLNESFNSLTEASCGGTEFSLYSMLECALTHFRNVPAHTSKECIFIVSSLSTTDAVSLKLIYEQLKMQSVRCSIICFLAEVYAFKKLCVTTQGKYGVALDREHFDLLLTEHLQPPPLLPKQGHQDSIVKWDFPLKKAKTIPSFCAWYILIDHFLNHELSGNLNSSDPSKSNEYSFVCPQCGSYYCQTPTNCLVCGLLLLTAPQLARAHQHLEPLPSFIEITPIEGSTCFACDEQFFSSTKAYLCKNCKVQVCIECDILLHESLQNKKIF
ncbi:General transcription factor IIH subunit [Meloidogyne graminicola]|uniref:General transcription factor IIH subunit n=1 Tax=Meloidogyne graminicola TaxID=189291 RepID=A0A8S9ZQW3_9BILA|nr:General transcription factor IIH subunit [Meloidogyne graminicola]